MESKEAAIFTIVNNENVFNGFKSSLESQKGVTYELFPIMNCNEEYNSARKAFNDNAHNGNAKYLIFSHPDIRFDDEYSLFDIVHEIGQIDDFGAVGIAGARRDGFNREIISSIVQGRNKERVGTQIKTTTPVQTVDECFFVVKSDYFKVHQFSGKEGWHLYGVEYCLDALVNGYRNYVVPSRVWHMSPGNSLDEKYMAQLEVLLAAYKNTFDVICTTVKAWPTKGVCPYLYRKYYWIKQRIKRMIVRR